MSSPPIADPFYGVLDRDWTTLSNTQRPNGKPWRGADGLLRAGAAVGAVATVADLAAAIAGHSHTIANVTGLQTELNGKASTNNPSFTGNVGIGTPNPSFNFVVQGGTGGIYLNRTGGSEPFILLRSDGGDAGTIGVSGGQIRGVVGGGIRFTNGNASTEWMRLSPEGLTVPSQISVGNTLVQTGKITLNAASIADALLINNGGIRANGAQAFFIFANTSSDTFPGWSNVINNFNNNHALLVRKIGTGVGDYIACQNSSSVDIFRVSSAGNIFTAGGFGFSGASAALPAQYAVTGHTTKRTLDKSTATLADLMDLVATLISDNIARGLLRAA